MPTSIARLQDLAEAATQYLVTWASIVVWDTLATLPDERRYIWPAKWTPLKVVDFLNRYVSSTLFLITTALLVTPISPGELDSSTSLDRQSVLTSGNSMIHLIMSIRVFAIYEKSRAIAAILVATLIAETSVAVYAATYAIRQLIDTAVRTKRAESLTVPMQRSVYLNPSPSSSTCKAAWSYPAAIIRNGSLSWCKSISAASFDTLILLLTVVRSVVVSRRVGMKLPIMDRLRRDSIFFYTVITTTHAVMLLFWYQNDEIIKSFNVPCSLSMNLLANRLVLSLHASSKDIVDQKLKPVDHFPLAPAAADASSRRPNAGCSSLLVSRLPFPRGPLTSGRVA
ncbi:hypothetical protein JCM10212_005542 [Sporobolomyces blumeae]